MPVCESVAVRVRKKKKEKNFGKFHVDAVCFFGVFRPSLTWGKYRAVKKFRLRFYRLYR